MTSPLVQHPDVIARRALSHRDELRALPNAIRVGVEILLEDDLRYEELEAERMSPYRRAALHELVMGACWRLHGLTTAIVGEGDYTPAPGPLMNGGGDDGES